MRLDFSENAITAKVHALYGRRLTRSQYEELCRKKNTSEIASYLKERTHLSELLTSVQPATVRSDQLENLLRKGRYNKYLDLVKYAAPKNREFYRSYVLGLLEIQLTNSSSASPALPKAICASGWKNSRRSKPTTICFRRWRAPNTTIPCCATAAPISRAPMSTTPAVKWR